MNKKRFTRLHTGFEKAFNAPLGVVFGWGAVSTVRNAAGQRQPYYDLGWTGQDGKRYHDHITEDAILKASLDYALGNRPLGEAHRKAAAVDALEKALEDIPDPEVRAHASQIVKKGRADVTSQPVQRVGDVPFVFPLVSSILDPLGIETDKTGLLIGVKPSTQIFQKLLTGELTGFSVGGQRGRDRIVEE